MEISTVKLEDIIPAEYNPRVELAQGDNSYKAIKRSVERFGMVEQLIVNKRTGKLVSGHQRLNVLKEIGAAEAEVIMIDTDEEHEKALNIALNKIDGRWDMQKLEALFAEIPNEEIKFTGFSEGELESLFNIPEACEESDLFAEADSAENGDGWAEEPEKPFNIYLSFPTRELAREWLDKREQADRMPKSGNTTIRMEGVEYGSGN